MTDNAENVIRVLIVDDIAAPDPHEYTITLQAPANGDTARIEGDRWAILGMRAQLQCFLSSAQGVTTSDGTYPGAEEYGRFIRATSPAIRQARFVTLLY
ncbi:MAG: hypothetical protein ACK2TX_03345, partial [Anaerolineales bacterium]